MAVFRFLVVRYGQPGIGIKLFQNAMPLGDPCEGWISLCAFRYQSANPSVLWFALALLGHLPPHQTSIKLSRNSLIPVPWFAIQAISGCHDLKDVRELRTSPLGKRTDSCSTSLFTRKAGWSVGQNGGDDSGHAHLRRPLLGHNEATQRWVLSGW
jgi:hypothetical protein